jgi:hypothetical protein
MDKTLFSCEERITQTIKTIQTVRNKIPNCYIVIAEGGRIDQSTIDMFTSMVDCLYMTNISHLAKSPGEATLLYRYLTSIQFESLDNIGTISKISGRYYLNDYFNWDSLPTDKTIISLVPVAWMGKPLYKTRYYRIPHKHLRHFVDGLCRYINSDEAAKAWPDIEHCFYQHNIIIHNNVYCPTILGVCGLITGNREFVQD